jgi:hypothetical protein
MFRPKVLTAALCLAACQAAAREPIGFADLPPDVRTHIEEVRTSCREQDPDFKPYSDTDGVEVVDLAGDGSQDLLVDNEQLCNGQHRGYNCTNRGCDLMIWKQVGPGKWRKIFEQHLHRKFVSITDSGHLAAIVASIWAGSKECHPKPGQTISSGESCDVLIHYRRGKWRFERLN